MNNIIENWSIGDLTVYKLGQYDYITQSPTYSRHVDQRTESSKGFMFCVLHILSGEVSSSRKHVGRKLLFRVLSVANCVLLLVSTVELATNWKFS